MTKPITIKHSGHLGDIIHSLPAIKAGCEKYKTTADIFIFIDHTWNFFKEETREHNGLISKTNFEMLKPLLNALPFINSVQEWNGEKIHYDFDTVKYRGKEIGLPHSNISRWYMYLFPELSCDLSKRVIDLHDLEGYWCENKNVPCATVHDSIVVNRTFRNVNPYINYMFLNQYENVCFAGTLQEYEVFIKQVPNARYIHVDDFLELAIVIGNAKLFIGNQSFCYSLAEQMKTPRLLECCGDATNVMPQGANGYDFYIQHGLEEIVREAIVKEIISN
jgi:hypothetical protein